MIEFINKIYWFFSPFVSPEEKRIYKILHSKNPQVEIRSLMQSNIFKLCVYLEYFSKGYQRLNKKNRKQLYRSVDFLRVEFLKFLQESQYDKTNKLKCFSYNLKTYNNKRSWNNPKGWANPENFDKFRW